MPRDTHPMTMFSAGILAMQRESVFVKRYNEGMNKMEYWEPMFEDVLDLLAKLPTLAAYIYRMKYKDDKHIPADPTLDMGGNFAHMMGIPRAVRRRRPDVLHPPLRPRVGQRLGPHHPPRGLGAVRLPTTRSPPASTASPARSTAWPTRRC